VGDEIWDQQSRVGIRIGPLSLEQYASFSSRRFGARTVEGPGEVFFE